jgi:hypothetical protein
MIGHVSGKPKISGRRPPISGLPEIRLLSAQVGVADLRCLARPKEAGSHLSVTDIIIHCRRRYDTASSQPTRIGKPSPASSVVVS